MPRRSDIHTILVPGSGAIVIGQAAEFDYSGTQAVKALKREGYRVVLVNSNPATIMTDPEIADATYIEPLTPEALEAIIVKERPDAMLPTVGGQTGLNLALALCENGVLEKYGVQLIGARLNAIRAAEDRLLFRETMQQNGIPVPRGGAAYSLKEAEALVKESGYPVIVRAAFALGGTGASWVYEASRLPVALRKAISESPIGQAWLEESVLGWKEYELDIDQPDNGIARTLEEARVVAQRIGYPVLVRPSFVLGGQAMAFVESEEYLAEFIEKAIEAAPGQPLLIDKFMEDAFEIDVDALADGERVVIGAMMQHIEEAGVHSGDAACVLPPYKVSAYHQGIMREYTGQLGLALGVRGLMNVQFALKDEVVYVLEVNPRASRTIPYASKATGLNMAFIAAQVMGGCTLASLEVTREPRIDGFFVKEAVLPFKKLPGASSLLGPEMRSTGEVMGHASRFGHAFAKSQIAAGTGLPQNGAVLITVNDFDKSAALKFARDMHRMGFKLYATPGTSGMFQTAGLPVEVVEKAMNGSTQIVDLIAEGKIQLVLNTPLGPHAHSDGAAIRSAAIAMYVPLLTTLSAARAAVSAIQAMNKKELKYRSLQDHYANQH